jgi:hypothetical protein
MELTAAFVSFAVLVAAWMAAPNRMAPVESGYEEQRAA